MKILHLKAENVKRLQVVDITPEPHMMVVGGNNGEGKTSSLDSIVIALGGKKAAPDMPVRKGEREAVIELTLDGLVVYKRIKPDGTQELEVRSSDGTIQTAPQKLLDSLYSQLSFDPLKFSTMEAKKQVEVLKALIPYDFSKTESDYKKLYDERTFVNRELKGLEGANLSTPYNPSIPEEEVSAQGLLDSLKTIQDTEIQKQGLLNNIERGKKRLAEIAEEKAKIEEWLKNNEPKVDLFPAVDSEAIKIKLTNIEEQNQTIRRNKEAKAIYQKMEKAKAEYNSLTKKLDALKADKEKAITSAKLPISGLTFTEDGVFYNGIPFENLSGAEAIKVSVAMGIALNPNLKVLLIRDGSLLDDKNLKVISDIAVQYDCQVWIERVGDGKECSVIIEDGLVKENRVGSK